MGKWLSDIVNEVESVVVYFKCAHKFADDKQQNICWKIVTMVIFLLMNRFACDR